MRDPSGRVGSCRSLDFADNDVVEGGGEEDGGKPLVPGGVACRSPQGLTWFDSCTPRGGGDATVVPPCDPHRRSLAEPSRKECNWSSAMSPVVATDDDDDAVFAAPPQPVGFKRGWGQFGLGLQRDGYSRFKPYLDVSRPGSLPDDDHASFLSLELTRDDTWAGVRVCCNHPSHSREGEGVYGGVSYLRGRMSPYLC